MNEENVADVHAEVDGPGTMFFLCCSLLPFLRGNFMTWN